MICLCPPLLLLGGGGEICMCPNCEDGSPLLLGRLWPLAPLLAAGSFLGVLQLSGCAPRGGGAGAGLLLGGRVAVVCPHLLKLLQRLERMWIKYLGRFSLWQV